MVTFLYHSSYLDVMLYSGAVHAADASPSPPISVSSHVLHLDVMLYAGATHAEDASPSPSIKF
jgi:hypothetical protein